VLAACGSGRTPDRDLGGLVVAPDETARPIDLGRAVRDPVELGRAIAVPHHDVARQLGPHVTTLRNATLVHDGATQVEALTVDTTIELGDAGAWRAVSNNSADYGREAIWSGGWLYLRPRYARWHKRAPNDEREPVTLSDEHGAELAAAWDLLAPAIGLSDRGTRTVAGRGGRVIELSLSPSPRKPAAEPLTQRTWRETRVVEAVAGEIVLDAETGVPLAAKLTGKLAFVRDGRRLTMTLDVSAAVRGIGIPVAIALPPPEDVVATPERRKEVDDHNALLENIAAPVGIDRADRAGTAAPSGGPPPRPAVSAPGKP
jgi:hypothetical protein